tara:strand:- start:2278 stop:2871 length:594 start_codon:yes stop_codon:yes gene_type:complete
MRHDLQFLKAFNSPFKRPKLEWYFGEVALGTPYFFPRKWVKPTHEMAMEAAMKEIARREDWNKANADSKFKHTVPSLDEIYEAMLIHSVAVPKKIGFDFVSLGYKTKWSNTDYRFEWSPRFSFVFFKWQIALTIVPIENNQYWEAWLYYNYHTKGTQRERIEQCKKEFPLKFTIWEKDTKRSVDYYDVILKDKYKTI